MLSRNQNAGNNSIQISDIKGDVNINQKSDFREIRDIFECLMEMNFPRLQEKAVDEAKKNVESMYRKLEEKLRTEFISISKTQIASVDVQYIMVKTVENVARKGEKIDLDFVASILIEKFKCDDSDDFNIILNQILEAMEKLTKDEIKLLAALYFYYKLFFSKIKNEAMLIDEFTKFDSLISCDIFDTRKLKSLEWKGLLRYTPGISIGTRMMKEHFKECYPESNIEKSDNPLIKKLYKLESTVHLTSVNVNLLGEAIALTYLKERYNTNINIKDFLFRS